ncbi:MAG: class I SAM-dependent rRNA methyltransferase, partial [Verrucomicrobia bacterium]|nr:class I SAM-dependent rRNA methyltransferase [Verrucomicrobiota bacterium]
MKDLPSIILKPTETDKIVSGHPWIYRAGISRMTGTAEAGAVVQVKDLKRRFLGIGFYNPKSKIVARIITKNREEIDAAFFEQRIRNALNLRKRFLPNATSYRVVNSEADSLSGLVVDKYEDVLVIQITSLGIELCKETIITVLKKLFAPKAVIERNDTAFRKSEGLPETPHIVHGDFETPLQASINGLVFEIDPLSGHKTGFYLDQQVNYELVSNLAKNRRVLDVFTGYAGFALHAARAGAIDVVGIDQSRESTDAATRNAEINKIAPAPSFAVDNAFDWLRNQTQVPKHEKLIPKFDLIILDPPSFTKSKHAIPEALRGYKEIHLRALRLLKPAGILATFCCSHHVDAQLFESAVMDAAKDNRQVLRRIAAYT